MEICSNSAGCDFAVFSEYASRSSELNQSWNFKELQKVMSQEVVHSFNDSEQSSLFKIVEEQELK